MLYSEKEDRKHRQKEARKQSCDGDRREGKGDHVRTKRGNGRRRTARRRGTDPRTPVMIDFKVVYMVNESYNEVTDRKQ